MPIALQRDEKGHVGCHCHRHSFGERRAKRCLSKRPSPLGPHAGGHRDGDAQGRAELVAGPPRLIPATDPAMQATPHSLFLLFPFEFPPKCLSRAGFAPFLAFLLCTQLRQRLQLHQCGAAADQLINLGEYLKFGILQNNLNIHPKMATAGELVPASSTPYQHQGPTSSGRSH